MQTKKKAQPPARQAHDWEAVNFKVSTGMREKIEADMVVSECHSLAEYFRFLLRQRFERVK